MHTGVSCFIVIQCILLWRWTSHLWNDIYTSRSTISIVLEHAKWSLYLLCLSKYTSMLECMLGKRHQLKLYAFMQTQKFERESISQASISWQQELTVSMKTSKHTDCYIYLDKLSSAPMSHRMVMQAVTARISR